MAPPCAVCGGTLGLVRVKRDDGTLRCLGCTFKEAPADVPLADAAMVVSKSTYDDLVARLRAPGQAWPPAFVADMAAAADAIEGLRAWRDDLSRQLVVRMEQRGIWRQHADEALAEVTRLTGERDDWRHAASRIELQRQAAVAALEEIAALPEVDAGYGPQIAHDALARLRAMYEEGRRG